MSLKSTCANLTDNNTIVIVSFRSYPFGGIIFASFLAYIYGVISSNSYFAEPVCHMH
jgi:hypothetical protein